MTDPSTVWAHHTWAVLTRLAVRAHPASPSYNAATHAIARMLPCGKCKAHAEAYLMATPPVAEGGSYLGWVMTFHNSVRARQGKAPIEQGVRAFAEEALTMRDVYECILRLNLPLWKRGATHGAPDMAQLLTASSEILHEPAGVADAVAQLTSGTQEDVVAAVVQGVGGIEAAAAIDAAAAHAPPRWQDPAPPATAAPSVRALNRSIMWIAIGGGVVLLAAIVVAVVLSSRRKRSAQGLSHGRGGGERKDVRSAPHRRA